MNFRDRNFFFEGILNQAFPHPVSVIGYSSIGGGCIHQAVKVESTQGNFFIKFNKLQDADMFAKEHQGLQVLRKAGALYAPEPVGHGILANHSYLITEYIEQGPRKPDFWEKFGQDLARLHQHHFELFGFDFDNYIGRLPQKNTYYKKWIDFFIEMRLEVQIKMAHDLGRIDSAFSARFSRFLERLVDLLPDESPSLIHGDLWSGNFMTGPEGNAVLIDPAVYYGHREMELSFTRMFGGFDYQFYKSYEEVYPLTPGSEERVDIYNVYPHLVHVNLFGNSYLGGVEKVLKRYV